MIKNPTYKLLPSLLILTLTAGLSMTACTSHNDNPVAIDDWRKDVPEVAKDIAGLEKYQTPIDYSKAEYWLSKPETADKAVDVFFVYPTTAGYREPTGIVDIDDAVMVEGARGTMAFQGSAFAESCNVFAPFYRQISLPATGTNYQQIIDYISQFDATRALDYYFEHLNQGRPFIIAGHSQGAATVISLLGHYLKAHPEYQERMVAAYPIGFSVTRQWLAENPQLKFAEGPTDTGVVATWNTEGPGNKQADNVCVLPGAISINPINWRRDDTYAPASDNLGSMDRATGNITTPGIADAQIDVERGVVVVTTPEAAAYVMVPEVQFLFGPESYHGQDYNFFYNNLKQNVADRVSAWQAKEELSQKPKVVRQQTGIEILSTTKMDYADEKNWVMRPETTEKPVDVFYLYPTLYTKRANTDPDVCQGWDEEVYASAKDNSSNYTLVFQESCNVFAPYYRQIALPIDEVVGRQYQTITNYTATKDPTDALDYYFKHLNQGRPFILAGHSQGSSITIALLASYFREHPELLSRMVAAYAVGFSVTKDWLAANPHVPFATGATDTGCIISWNTEGPGNRNLYNLVVSPGAVSINPISWRLDDTHVDASDNPGSISFSTGQVTTPGVADAQIDMERGVVVVTTTNPTTQGMPVYHEQFGPESYHNQDYAFFYSSIRKNVADRIAAWQNK